MLRWSCHASFTFGNNEKMNVSQSYVGQEVFVRRFYAGTICWHLGVVLRVIHGRLTVMVRRPPGIVEACDDDLRGIEEQAGIVLAL